MSEEKERKKRLARTRNAIEDRIEAEMDRRVNEELKKLVDPAGLKELKKIERQQERRRPKIIEAKNHIDDLLTDVRNIADEVEKTAGWDPQATMSAAVEMRKKVEQLIVGVRRLNKL